MQEMQRDVGLITESERSPGVGHGNPLSILAWRLPMDRGAWWATVHRVPDSDITEMTERAITMIMYKLIRNTADMCKEKFFVGVFYFSSQKISFFLQISRDI